MKRLLTIAALLLASSVAHAGDSYSFEIGGRTIHIEAPSDCDQPSCVSVSIPGVYESGPKRGRARNNSPEPQAKAEPAPRPGPAAPAAPKSEQSRDQADRTPPAAAPAPAASPPAIQSSARSEPPPAAAAVVTAVPVSTPIQKEQAPAANPTAASPLGIWQTEKKEGLIRIEPCGANLCGYSVEAGTSANGEEVLINMRPVSGTKWSGRIHDPKSGGNYESTIALKGPDSLQVQGCAFGGMFCGGQTWSRLN